MSLQELNLKIWVMEEVRNDDMPERMGQKLKTSEIIEFGII